MNPTYVYHYHILCGDPAGPRAAIDGIFQSDTPILDMETFRQVKNKLEEGIEPVPPDIKKLQWSLTNLSLLHTVKDRVVT